MRNYHWECTHKSGRGPTWFELRGYKKRAFVYHTVGNFWMWSVGEESPRGYRNGKGTYKTFWAAGAALLRSLRRRS